MWYQMITIKLSILSPSAIIWYLHIYSKQFIRTTDANKQLDSWACPVEVQVVKKKVFDMITTHYFGVLPRWAEILLETIEFQHNKFASRQTRSWIIQRIRESVTNPKMAFWVRWSFCGYPNVRYVHLFFVPSNEIF